jgi:hypothetical protein
MTAHVRTVGDLLADHLTARGLLVDDRLETGARDRHRAPGDE